MKKSKIVQILAAFSMLPMSISAYAVSTFNSGISVTLTVNDIENLSNQAVDLSELEYSGNFFYIADSDAYTTGNGAVSTEITHSPFPGSIEIGSSYTQTFNVAANGGNGTVDAYYLVWSDLSIFNNSLTDSYRINLSIDYNMTASASGDFAHTDVSFDFYNEDFSQSGWDGLTASVYGLTNDSVGQSLWFDLILSPGAFESIYADVGVSGSLSAVPVPAAAWLFASAVAGLAGLKRRERAISEV